MGFTSFWALVSRMFGVSTPSQCACGTDHECLPVRMVRHFFLGYIAPGRAKRCSCWRAQKPTVCGSDAMLIVFREIHDSTTVQMCHSPGRTCSRTCTIVAIRSKKLQRLIWAAGLCAHEAFQCRSISGTGRLREISYAPHHLFGAGAV